MGRPRDRGRLGIAPPARKRGPRCQPAASGTCRAGTDGRRRAAARQAEVQRRKTSLTSSTSAVTIRTPRRAGSTTGSDGAGARSTCSTDAATGTSTGRRSASRASRSSVGSRRGRSRWSPRRRRSLSWRRPVPLVQTRAASASGSRDPAGPDRSGPGRRASGSASARHGPRSSCPGRRSASGLLACLPAAPQLYTAGSPPTMIYTCNSHVSTWNVYGNDA